MLGYIGFALIFAAAVLAPIHVTILVSLGLIFIMWDEL